MTPIELRQIKKNLLKNPRCFFSNETTQHLDLFHIIPKGTHPEYKFLESNLVLAKREYNDIWVDRGTAQQVMTIPNVEKGFLRMKQVDEQYYNKKLDMMKDNLPEEEYKELTQKIDRLIYVNRLYDELLRNIKVKR